MLLKEMLTQEVLYESARIRAVDGLDLLHLYWSSYWIRSRHRFSQLFAQNLPTFKCWWIIKIIIIMFFFCLFKSSGCISSFEILHVQIFTKQNILGAMIIYLFIFNDQIPWCWLARVALTPFRPCAYLFIYLFIANKKIK